jgi:hypothetical protein
MVIGSYGRSTKYTQIEIMIDDPHCFLGRHGTKPPTRQNIPKQRDSSALKMGMTEQNCPWHGIGWYDIY